MKTINRSTILGIVAAFAICAVVAIAASHAPGVHMLGGLVADPGSLLILASAPAAVTGKLLKARVLVDGHGLKVGQIVEGSADQIKALVKQGAVDDAKAAVTYAAGEGATVARLADHSPDPVTQLTPEQQAHLEAEEAEAKRLRGEA